MANKLIKPFLVKLKYVVIVHILAFSSLFLFSFNETRQLADDIWKQLGMSKAQGTDGIRQSFLNGYLSYYGAKNAKNIAVGNRAAVATDLLAYTRQFISSDAFKKEYDRMRKDAKPVEPENKVRTKEQLRKDEIAKTEKSLKEAEATSKTSAEMAKVMKGSIDYLKKTLVEIQDPQNKNIEYMHQGEQMDYEREVKSYQERLAKWEKEYPEDYRQMVKNRLQAFLDLSATVDFGAELKQVGNKKKFVNPVYEAKSDNWKQVYRAGREVIEPARKVATQWIKELN